MRLAWNPFAALLVWWNPNDRQELVHQYAAVKQLPLFLADVAIRGSVFTPFDPAMDIRIAEGRRQLALEIMRVAGADIPALMKFVLANTRPKQEDQPR